MQNRATLTGYLGKDPVLGTTCNQTPFAVLSLATPRFCRLEVFPARHRRHWEQREEVDHRDPRLPHYESGPNGETRPVWRAPPAAGLIFLCRSRFRIPSSAPVMQPCAMSNFTQGFSAYACFLPEFQDLQLSKQQGGHRRPRKGRPNSPSSSLSKLDYHEEHVRHTVVFATGWT